MAGKGIYIQNGGGTTVQIMPNVSAPYIAVDELHHMLYWSGTFVNPGGGRRPGIFQLSLGTSSSQNWNNTRNHTVFAIPFSITDQDEEILPGNEAVVLPVKMTWLEYDWLGDSIYFVDLNRGICICNRNSSCAIVVNKTSIDGNLRSTKIALDVERG